MNGWTGSLKARTRHESQRPQPPLHTIADKFGRLQAVADWARVNMALCAKRTVMWAVSRQEAFACLSGHGEAGESRHPPPAVASV